MSEQNYNIFASTSSLHLTEEEYNDDKEFFSAWSDSDNWSNSDKELFSAWSNSDEEFFNTWSDNNISASDTSSISSEDLKDFENETLYDNEIFEQELKDEIIDNSELTPCIIIDSIGGKIQRCGETQNLRQLHNLFGIWQVDRDAIKEVDGVLSKLGVCNSHFQFDNKYLHKNSKQLIDFKQGVI